MVPYIFFRNEGWYPVECKDDADVLVHVELNPGTIRVEDINRRVVYPVPSLLPGATTMKYFWKGVLAVADVMRKAAGVR